MKYDSLDDPEYRTRLTEAAFVRIHYALEEIRSVSPSSLLQLNQSILDLMNYHESVIIPVIAADEAENNASDRRKREYPTDRLNRILGLGDQYVAHSLRYDPSDAGMIIHTEDCLGCRVERSRALNEH